MPSVKETPVLVIGAGPAGLATSAELRRAGVEHAVLERGSQPGHVWANLYDSLTLHTGKHLSALPGMPFPRTTPLFPTRQHFLDYLHEYAAKLAAPIEAARPVTALERANGGWMAHTPAGTVRAGAVVMATGIVSNPRIPDLPGRDMYHGRVMHSSAYRRPTGFEGHSVLVVGVGNSGGEIGTELARHGAHVTIAVRSGANVVPLTLFGIPIQYFAFYLRKLPRPVARRISAAVGAITELRRGRPVLPKPPYGPLDAIPLIGFHLVDAIREGLIEVRGGLQRLTPSGARFADGVEEPFDDVVLATGFTPALASLGGLVRTDDKGFALRSDRVTSADQPNLYFVGHNYDASGGLYNIGVDASLVAKRLAMVRPDPPR
jgi:indole-3-pyruvate monooxygenase